MVLYANSNPTVLNFDQENGMVRITQREFGSDKQHTVIIEIDDLREFIESIES